MVLNSIIISLGLVKMLYIKRLALRHISLTLYQRSKKVII